MIKVAVTGAAGRMGSGIIRKITEQDDMEVVAAIEMPNTPLAGKDAGLQAGIDELGVAAALYLGAFVLNDDILHMFEPTANFRIPLLQLLVFL